MARATLKCGHHLKLQCTYDRANQQSARRRGARVGHAASSLICMGPIGLILSIADNLMLKKFSFRADRIFPLSLRARYIWPFLRVSLLSCSTSAEFVSAPDIESFDSPRFNGSRLLALAIH